MHGFQKAYRSECGYYQVHQHAGYWVEYYMNNDGGWNLQEDSWDEAMVDGEFTNFNDRDEGAITYTKE